MSSIQAEAWEVGMPVRFVEAYAVEASPESFPCPRIAPGTRGVVTRVKASSVWVVADGEDSPVELWFAAGAAAGLPTTRLLRREDE